MTAGLMQLHTSALRAEIDRLTSRVAELDRQVQAAPKAPAVPDIAPGGEILARLGAALTKGPADAGLARLFLTSCAAELLLCPETCGKRIAPGGDLEAALAQALKHNTDADAAAHLARTRKHTGT